MKLTTLNSQNLHEEELHYALNVMLIYRDVDYTKSIRGERKSRFGRRKTTVRYSRGDGLDVWVWRSFFSIKSRVYWDKLVRKNWEETRKKK